jgi:Ca-activated chloride channel family protein
MKLWFLSALLVPAWIWFFVHKKKVNRSLGFIYGQRPQTSKFYTQFNVASTLRLVFFSLAWIFLVIALSNPVWGTASVPVQRSGSAVAFVYDISWSMTAKDAEPDSSKTRLEKVQDFSENLLSGMRNIEVSAVIAKGQSILAVPLTADYNAHQALIKSLSPELMSASGSNPADGILKALETFPSQIARYSTIVVFTDGEGNEQEIEKAVYEAARCGVAVVFVGFGSEKGTFVLAGDRKTKVKTFLHRQKISGLLKNVQDKVPLTPVLFLDSNDASAVKKVYAVINGGENTSGTVLKTGYEVQPVKRHGLFILWAVIFLCSGFFTSEINYQAKAKKTSSKKNISVLLVLCLFILVSCNNNVNDAYDILSGTLYFHSANYQKAISKFVKKAGYEKIHKYADF